MKKSILVTGAGSGIGLGVARHFADLGHHVIVTDVTERNLNDAKTLLNKSSCEFHLLDVTQQTSVDELIKNIELMPNVLINNAGVQHVEKLESFPIDKWDFLIQVMLVGVARITQAFLPSMLENNFGRIIHIGSLHSLVASPYKTAYIAAKHGLLGLSKSLALELGKKDITVNTVCPAYVRTPLVEKQIAQQAEQHGLSENEVIDTIMLKPMPKKAFIEVSEIAGTCEFLTSPAAKNITAQAIALDGGWIAQ